MESHSAMSTVSKLLDMLIARVGIRVVSCWILNIFPRLYEKRNCSAHSLTHSLAVLHRASLTVAPIAGTCGGAEIVFEIWNNTRMVRRD